MPTATSFNFSGLLYAVTPDGPDTVRLLAGSEAALAGGAALLQYRDKVSAMGEKLVRARALKALCQRYNVPLIINDDIALAVACGADGVHLGEADGSVYDARRLLPPTAIIGASCYNDLALARRAVAAGASYVAFGACFDSPTKPVACSVTPAQLADFRTALGPEVAICGIGGITLANVAQIQPHVNAVALISELFGPSDHPHAPAIVQQRAQNFLALQTLETAPA